MVPILTPTSRITEINQYEPFRICSVTWIDKKPSKQNHLTFSACLGDIGFKLCFFFLKSMFSFPIDFALSFAYWTTPSKALLKLCSVCSLEQRVNL